MEDETSQFKNSVQNLYNDVNTFAIYLNSFINTLSDSRSLQENLLLIGYANFMWKQIIDDKEIIQACKDKVWENDENKN